MSSKKFFCVCMYKMVQISKKGYEKRKIEIIDKQKRFRSRIRIGNWAQTFDKCDPEKQKYRHKLTPNAEYGQCRVFVRNDLVERKIKSCRKSSKKFLEFKKKLGLDPDVVPCDEQDIMSALQVEFEGEIIHTQYYIENKRLDAYFPKYKIGREVDEYNHEDRNFKYEKSRQFVIESHGITIIRTNPGEADFNINKLVNQIYTCIIKSTKKSRIDDISKRLLKQNLNQITQ